MTTTTPFSCPICYSTEVEDELVIKKLDDCGHTFCESCIDDWFKRKKECPLCREDYSYSRKIDEAGMTVSLCFCVASVINFTLILLYVDKPDPRRALLFNAAMYFLVGVILSFLSIKKVQQAIVKVETRLTEKMLSCF